MPEKRQQSQKELDSQDVLIKLAIEEKKLKLKLSFDALASIFQVKATTLKYRSQGRLSKAEESQRRQKLKVHEEESLCKWILYRESIGVPPQHYQVREMANFLIASRGIEPYDPVGVNWIQGFLRRQVGIKSKIVKPRDTIRAKSETPEKFNEWFQRVRKTIEDHGIVENDVYNFDETGFAMGLLGTTRIITGSEVREESTLLQPGNREWVTAIECVSAGGFAISPFVIFKGKNLIQDWFHGLPKKWRIGVSENGWTNDKMALNWLEKVFIPESDSLRVGKYRLLLFDGHGSHLTPEFVKKCEENNILIQCMPPHASHRLQPLDVVCFAVLKKAYRKSIQARMSLRVHTINKYEFLAAYANARKVAFTAALIISSFATAGLFPFDPDRVINKLPRLFLSTQQRQEGTGRIHPEDIFFPSEYEEIIELESEFGKLIKKVDHGPRSPIKAVMKEYQKKIHSALQRANILKQELDREREANIVLQKKKTRPKRKYIKESDLSVEEVEELSLPNPEGVETETILTQEMMNNGSPVRKKGRRLCGKCRLPGHRIETCTKKNI